MKIEIDDYVKKQFKFDFEKHICSIIKKVSPEHLADLHKIQVLNYSPEKHRRKSLGFYYGKIEGEKLPRIVICANNIFNGLPKLILGLTFIPRVFLARTIYHEIAHHYQRLRHGIVRKDWEKDADNYTKSMMKKHFKLELLVIKIIFWPFILIQKLLNKIGGKNND